jgi:hypothetical protein
MMPKFMVKWFLYIVLGFIGVRVTTLPDGVVDTLIAFFLLLF